ncbi:17850_t:CDS:1 [Funneliformis caledonium]|uniref:17850_t:CDS:1 n=1 Tax=Funneliformis caledonium TaxID=1117310 RepID=A0A9N8V978_9GLOM|nr:17850_t:CDS:1 [Funneliformis caledonium]
MGDKLSGVGKESGNKSFGEKGSKIETKFPITNSPDFVQYERNESSATPSSNSVDQSNVKRQCTGSNLLVNPPFPPNVDPSALAIDLLNNKKTSKKLLNEFFIFRKEFVRELKRQNLRPRQTKVSTLASTSWHLQPPSVKDEYRRLARETERFLMIARSKKHEDSKSTKTESIKSSRTSPDPAPDSTSIKPSSALPVSNPNNLQISVSPQTSHFEHQLFRTYDALNPSVLNPSLRHTTTQLASDLQISQPSVYASNNPLNFERVGVNSGDRSIQLDTFEGIFLYGQGNVNSMPAGCQNLGNNILNLGNLDTLEHQHFLHLRTSEPYDYRNTMSYHSQRQSYPEFLEPSWSTLGDNLSQFTDMSPVNRLVSVSSSGQHDYPSPYQRQYVETSMITRSLEAEKVPIVPSQRYRNRNAPSVQGTNIDTSTSSSVQSTKIPLEILRGMTPSP